MINLPPAHLQIVLDILARYAPQHEVWAFGSRVQGNSGTYSDLDLAIIAEEPLGEALTDLRIAFSESDLPFKVDVVDWAVTKPHFREIIEQHHEVLTPQARLRPSSRPA